MSKKNEEWGERDTERGWEGKCDTNQKKKKARKKQKREIKRWEREKKKVDRMGREERFSTLWQGVRWMGQV